MDVTASAVTVQQQQTHRALFESGAKPRTASQSSSTGSVLDTNKSRVGDVAPDPAAFRARLKHRAKPSSSSGGGSTTTVGAYDKVLDTARRLAELEIQRSQDQIYIRTLEQTRGTLMRDAQSAIRARAEAEKALIGEREAKRALEEAVVVKEEAVRIAKLERDRADRAEGRVGEVEKMLRVSEERVCELESVLEGEMKRRRDWETGLEEALVY